MEPLYPATKQRQKHEAHASKKKNTPVESLKRKKMEQGATNTREHTVKRAVRPKTRKEHDGGTKNSTDKTGKDDTRNENPEKKGAGGI